MCEPTTDDSLRGELVLKNPVGSSQHTSCDAQARHEIVDDCEQGGSPLQRNPKRLDAAIEGNSHNEGHIEPVDVFVPIGSGDGGISDVRFLGIIGSAPIWLRGLCHG